LIIYFIIKFNYFIKKNEYNIYKDIVFKYNMTEIEYINYIDYKKIEIDNLPSNVKISTMSASCKLNTEINIVNIEKYLDLNINDVVRIYKKRHEIIKSLIPLEKKIKEIL